MVNRTNEILLAAGVLLTASTITTDAIGGCRTVFQGIYSHFECDENPIPKPPPIPKLPSVPLPNVPRDVDIVGKKNELMARVQNINQQFQQLQNRVAQYQAVPGYVAQLSSPVRQQREAAYAWLRSQQLLRSNKDGIIRGQQQSGAFVIQGIEIDQVDEVMFAKAVAASIVLGNPGPVLGYLQMLLTETYQRVSQNIQNQAPVIQQQILSNLNMLVINAINQSMSGGGPVQMPIPSVNIQAGLATYNNWVDVIYDEPRLEPTQNILGIQLYEIRTQRKQLNLPCPNTFQPFVLLRLGFG